MFMDLRRMEYHILLHGVPREHWLHRRALDETRGGESPTRDANRVETLARFVPFGFSRDDSLRIPQGHETEENLTRAFTVVMRFAEVWCKIESLPKSTQSVCISDITAVEATSQYPIEIVSTVKEAHIEAGVIDSTQSLCETCLHDALVSCLENSMYIDS